MHHRATPASPIASTSRIPYGLPVSSSIVVGGGPSGGRTSAATLSTTARPTGSSLPSRPPHALHLPRRRTPLAHATATTTTPTIRTFSSTPTAFFLSASSPSPRRAAHRLLHPVARQRLTHLAFVLAGGLSVLTVSMGMSGSLGGGGHGGHGGGGKGEWSSGSFLRPGCPARKDAAVALQEEDSYGNGARGGARSGTQMGMKGGWKGQGRFLEDPVVAVAVAAAAAAPGPAVTTLTTPAAAHASDDKEGARGRTRAGRSSSVQEETTGVARPPGGGVERRGRGWVEGASERLV